MEASYLMTLMTRHVMRAAVSTQMKMTIFFRVGRCAIRGERRNPTSASVEFPLRCSTLSVDDGEDEDVEFMCVVDEGVNGSPLTLQRAAARRVNARLKDTIVVQK